MLPEKINILIVGFGSAGKRHLKTAHDALGERVGNVGLVDPIFESVIPKLSHDFYTSLADALDDKNWHIGVIASPPDEHLWHIEACLLYKLHVLCEKPLSDMRVQKDRCDKMLAMGDIHKVMIAYNYRFNDSLLQLADSGEHAISDVWQLKSVTLRESFPSWGLLLDHMSHAVDILRWRSNSGLVIDNVKQSKHDMCQEHIIEGYLVEGGDLFRLHDWTCLGDNAKNNSSLVTPKGLYKIDRSPKMFSKMWKAFIENADSNKPQQPSFEEAYITQKILWEVGKKLNDR